MEKAYRNLGYYFLLLIPLIFIGFYKTYFIQFPSFKENITSWMHIHAMIATLWIIMLIVQPLLIRNKKFKQHRLVGKISYVVFPLLILSFIPQILRVINSGYPEFVFFPLADSVLLILFYGFAIANRKKTPKHMRYMIGAATVFLGPTFGRIGPLLLSLSEKLTQNLLYAFIYLILAGLIWMDQKHKRNFYPYLVIALGWVVHQIIFNMLF